MLDDDFKNLKRSAVVFVCMLRTWKQGWKASGQVLLL